MSALAEITVTYQTREGWHLFTSDQMDGLFVASPDLETAFEDVPNAVSMLLKLDHDFDCVVQPKLDFESFRALLGSHGKARRCANLWQQESGIRSKRMGATCSCSLLHLLTKATPLRREHDRAAGPV